MSNNKLKDLQYVDVNTGEIMSNMPVMFFPKSSPYRKGNWSMISHDGLIKLVTDYNLTGSSLKVLLYCIANIDYHNQIFMCKASMAKDLGWSTAMFYKSFKPLVEQGLIWKTDKKIGNGYVYMINPSIVWKGSAKDLNAFLKNCADEKLRDFKNSKAIA